MKLKKTITASAHCGDIKLSVDLTTDGLTRTEARNRFDELTGVMMNALAIQARVPLSRIRIR